MRTFGALSCLQLAIKDLRSRHIRLVLLATPCTPYYSLHLNKQRHEVLLLHVSAEYMVWCVVYSCARSSGNSMFPMRYLRHILRGSTMKR